MLMDINKLRHGPSFNIHNIDIFDGCGQCIQSMVLRDIISVLKEILSNPDLKDKTMYMPVKLWTSAEMDE